MSGRERKEGGNKNGKWKQGKGKKKRESGEGGRWEKVNTAKRRQKTERKAESE